jgi:hypothetical protein
MIDHEQPENVEYFSYLGEKVSNAICKREIKSRIAITKTPFN